MFYKYVFQLVNNHLPSFRNGAERSEKSIRRNTTKQISQSFLLRYDEICYFLAYLKFLPIKRADSPNSSSIRNNWLYFAILSEREAEPVLI